jgi:carbonic anhydrase
LTGIADNICGTGKNQSPIDLKTNGWPMKDSNFDNFNKIYTDQEVDVEVVWNGHTSQVALTKPGQSTQTIYSEHSADGHKGGTTYNGV